MSSQSPAPGGGTTANRAIFSDLPLGARFVLDGEVCEKLERDLRDGMLHCSNARTAGGRCILLEEDAPVEPLGPSLA